MKKIMFLIIGVACILSLYYAIRSMIGKKDNTTQQQIHIAVFAPITHSALQEIELGFKEELQKLSQRHYDFKVFNANGNKTLLRAQAEEIIQGQYDLIFTMGAACSQTIAELLKKKGLKTPQVFAGVDGPEFAHSLASMNKSTTGIYVQSDYTQELDVLFRLKPSTKNILLVYDPAHGTGLVKQKNEIETYIKKYGSFLHTVEIYQTNEIQQKVVGALSNVDVVLVLTDNTVVAGIDALIALCNRFGITLMVSDLPSGEKGAVIAYGIREYDSGSEAAHKAYEILKGKKTEEISVTALTNFQTRINKNAMKMQNLELDAKALQQLKGQY